MNKQFIKVPKGVRYVGTWSDFHLSNFPAKCIINKVIPGCGFTRFCIETPWENVILCSPRKILLQNKYEQHPGLVYLVKNEIEQDPGVDMDITKDRKVIEVEDPSLDRLTKVKSRLHTELREYLGSHIQHKILVTYDSFRILKEVLQEMGIFQNFKIVIDEMQAIMQDARFKSSTEINFLYHLQNSHSAIFVSATPMLEEYLDDLPEFRDLPYFEFDWKTEDFSRIIKPDLDVRRMSGIVAESKKIIGKFKAGDYDTIQTIENGVPVTKYATELVFYVNSVSMITRIIKANDLEDSEVNILCSNTEDNQKKLWARLSTGKSQKAGTVKPFTIGRVPLEGEDRKPITICTRTVYLGADFYSNCAKSYIFSDANSDYLSVDISQDLPQILGRQRCDNNPWKNSAVFYYRPLKSDERKTKDQFEARVKEKDNSTKDLLKSWEMVDKSAKESLVTTYMDSILVSHYKNNYVSVNKIELIDPVTGKKTYSRVPVPNHLVRAAERRAFDIQQIDYADRFSVFAAITGEFGDGSISQVDDGSVEFQVKEFYKVYDGLTKVSDRLKLLCEVTLSPAAREVILAQLPDTDKVKYFYQAAGPERCKANSYSPKRISNDIGISYFSKSEVAVEIYKDFNIRDKVLWPQIKETLRQIYQKIGYDKTPKATDLKDFFEVKEYKVTDPTTKKRIHGYELIKRLL